MLDTRSLRRCLLLCAVLVVAVSGMAQGVAAEQSRPALSASLEEFTRPLLFDYGSWSKRVTVEDGALVVRIPDGRGGGGRNFVAPIDLSAKASMSPAVVVTIGPDHRAKRMRIMLRDDRGGSAIWIFEVGPERVGHPVMLLPVDMAPLTAPNDIETQALDLTRVAQLQVQGDWSEDPFDFRVDEIGLVEPSLEMIDVRKRKSAADLAANQAADSKRRTPGQVRHADTSPVVSHVGLVDRDILGVTIADGVHVQSKLVPYVPQPGDRIAYDDKGVLVDIGGQIRIEGSRRTLTRNGKAVGYIAGGRDGRLSLWPLESRTGDRLDLTTIDDVDSYRIESNDDHEYAESRKPLAVFRKTKPTNRIYPTEQQTLRHIVYLKLPRPVIQGRTYTLAFPGVNVATPSLGFTFDATKLRSEAIHTQQIGYRPDDPFKRAYLSIWLGTGGGHAISGLDAFHLLDTLGHVVHSGHIKQVLAADGKEQVRGGSNLSQTAVYAMDFSEFQRPGVYVVYVPGLGVSYPFDIRADVWRQAFETAMHGFLVQRSGIALGPPATSFVRARPMHPADGVRVFKSTTPLAQTSGADDWFEALVKGRTDELNANAWGGYHDAGDFDRNANHMWASYEHLELLEIFPQFFGKQRLRLPANEAKDKLPDLLNEVLWNMECWRRLQNADGGVSGGIESSSHPRPGETSTTDSLVLMTYAPDAGSTYLYAGVAARTARVAKAYDDALAATYRMSALLAWEWAERHRSESHSDVRNTAAADLFAMTGEDRFDLAFQETTKLKGSAPLIEQQGAAFLYARLPKGVGSEELKALARRRLLAQADAAIDYADGNAFGLTVEIKDTPLIGPVGAFTTPGMSSRILPRAHYLSGEKKYLAGAIRACNFSLGANPDNMTMTTGVGKAFPKAPLHLDSRFSGQTAPAGLTVYGAYDTVSLPSFAQSSDWVHKWYVGRTMTPYSRTWPAAEGYVDLFLWPMMNEYTIRQNMGPTSYFWGYLAARR